MYVYCAYMYSLYLCVYCFSVYRYIYLGVCSFCAVATLRRGALLFLCNLCSRFHHCSRFDHFCRVMRWLLAFCTSIPLQAFLCTFCRTFCPQRLQRSFYAVFRAVLSGLIVWRVHLHSLHHLSRLYSLICGKIAVFRGV